MSDVVKAAEGSLSQEMMRVVAEREQRIAAHEAQVRERERALERKEGEQRSMGAQLRCVWREEGEQRTTGAQVVSEVVR